MPPPPEARNNSVASNSNSTANNSSAKSQNHTNNNSSNNEPISISLAELKQSGFGQGGNGASSQPRFISYGGKIIKIQQIIQREAAAAAAAAANSSGGGGGGGSSSSGSHPHHGGHGQHHQQHMSKAAAAAARQRKRRLELARMRGAERAVVYGQQQHGGGGGGGSNGQSSSSSSKSGRNHGSNLGIGHSTDSMNNILNRRARSENFSIAESSDLLNIWASPEVQWQLRNNVRNQSVWDVVADQMCQLGHNRTGVQCKNRIQNCTGLYYRIKKSGEDPMQFNFPHFKLMDDVLEKKKTGASLGPGFSSSAAGTSMTAGSSKRSSSASAQNSQSYYNSNNSSHAMINNHGMEQGGAGGGGYYGDDGMGYEGQDNSYDNNDGVNQYLHNALSPEISLSEGESPLHMDGGQLQLRENLDADTEDGYDMDETAEEDDLPQLTNSVGGAPKRSFSSSFGGGSGGGQVANYPMKRARGGSAASSSRTSGNPFDGTGADDPILTYMAEMVAIEKEWLQMERERADNERSVMLYMMQLLQTLVCPTGEEGGESEQQDDKETAASEEEAQTPETLSEKDNNGGTTSSSGATSSAAAAAAASTTRSYDLSQMFGGADEDDEEGDETETSDGKH